MAGEGEAVLQKQDRLRYRLSGFQRLVNQSRRVIAEALATMPRPYVAWSGGKDSTVVLALVREQYPAVPVVWSDDELEAPETVEYITRLAREWNLNLTIVASHATHAGWFRAWTNRPFWREPLPGTVLLPEEERHTDIWMARQGWDGTFLGLRKSERFNRRAYLTSRGLLTRTAMKGWQCNPIGWWAVDDVWAFLGGEQIPYNPVYDVLARIGVPRHEQRVGPLPLSVGWHLHMGWPGMAQQLVERYGRRWTW